MKRTTAGTARYPIADVSQLKALHVSDETTAAVIENTNVIWKRPMKIKVRDGDVFPLNRAQQIWWGDSPEVMQIALFAGQEMMATTDDAGWVELDYMGHIGSGFSSMVDAKAAAPEFARAVLERLRNRIEDVF